MTCGSTWDALLAERIYVDQLQSRVVGDDHIRHSHLILFDDARCPIPIHSTIWNLFFNNKHLNHHLSPDDDYYRKYPPAGDISLRLPIVDLRKIPDVQVVFEPFVHYMYTEEQYQMYLRWLAPTAEEGDDVNNLSDLRKKEIFAKSLEVTNVLFNQATEWGIKERNFLEVVNDYATDIIASMMQYN